jgi:hypothetical protein
VKKRRGIGAFFMFRERAFHIGKSGGPGAPDAHFFVSLISQVLVVPCESACYLSLEGAFD